MATKKQTNKTNSQETNSQALVKVDVIEQFCAVSEQARVVNEQVETLRPQAAEALQEMFNTKREMRNFTGVLNYKGHSIRIQRPKSYTWEQNTQIDDPQIAYYKAMCKQYDDLNTQLKAKRKEMKGVAETLAVKYPDSESIKHGFTVAVLS